jgi:hypothetical protein
VKLVVGKGNLLSQVYRLLGLHGRFGSHGSSSSHKPWLHPSSSSSSGSRQGTAAAEQQQAATGAAAAAAAAGDDDAAVRGVEVWSGPLRVTMEAPGRFRTQRVDMLLGGWVMLLLPPLVVLAPALWMCTLRPGAMRMCCSCAALRASAPHHVAPPPGCARARAHTHHHAATTHTGSGRSSLHVALWGVVDAASNTIDFTVGLPASTLAKAGIAGLPPAYMLPVAVSGPLHRPTIEWNAAGALSVTCDGQVVCV